MWICDIRVCRQVMQRELHRQGFPSLLGPMPNPWTGIGNPYTRVEVIERLRDTLSKGEPIIAAGAGTGISAKFIEKGGADLIIIYNSGRYRMMGHGSIAGMMGYGDANAVAMEIGEFEVLPVVKEIPVICGVHCTDPRRRPRGPLPRRRLPCAPGCRRGSSRGAGRRGTRR